MRVCSSRNRDLQRRRPLTLCTRCGAELYPGESFWQINGQQVCEQCLLPLAREEFAAHRRICGEEERN